MGELSDEELIRVIKKALKTGVPCDDGTSKLPPHIYPQSRAA